MSRGFVKESDQEALPIVPPRADLPAGVTNYVTPAGHAELVAEREALGDALEQVSFADENERRIAVNLINAKLQLLLERIATAKIVNLAQQPANEVRFGATVSFQADNDPKLQTFQIVGVDQANIAKHKIAFTSPIAKVLIDKKVGDKAVLQLGKTQRVFTIREIKY